MPSLRCAVSLAVGLALAGCGARSSVLDANGQLAGAGAAGGGASGTGASGTTSSTGAGGSCSALALTGPEAVVPAPAGFEAREQALAALDPEMSLAVLVFAMGPPAPPGPSPAPIGDTTFAPWGSWPPSFVDPHQIATSGGHAFAIAPGAPGAFSLVFDMLAENPLGGSMAFDWNVDPHGIAAAEVFDFEGCDTLFLAKNGDLRLLGYDRLLGPGHNFVGDVWQGDAGLTGVYGLACSPEPLVAAAAPLGDGFLFAVAASVMGPCQVMGEGVANDIEVHLLSPSGGFDWLAKASTMSGADGVVNLALSPRDDGAWLFDRRRGQDKTTQSVKARRLDSDGQVASADLEVVPAGRGAFAVATRGNGFVIAWLDALDPSAPALGLAVFDELGGMVATNVFTPDVAAFAEAPLSLLVSPDGAEVVLAWSARPPGQAGKAQIHVARFGCLGV